MNIEITDPDPIVRDKQHAVKFTTEWDENNSSANVVHLTTKELYDLLEVVVDRIQGLAH